jgi:hypothetical protein
VHKTVRAVGFGSGLMCMGGWGILWLEASWQQEDHQAAGRMLFAASVLLLFCVALIVAQLVQPWMVRTREQLLRIEYRLAELNATREARPSDR